MGWFSLCFILMFGLIDINNSLRDIKQEIRHLKVK